MISDIVFLHSQIFFWFIYGFCFFFWYFICSSLWTYILLQSLNITKSLWNSRLLNLTFGALGSIVYLLFWILLMISCRFSVFSSVSLNILVKLNSILYLYSCSGSLNLSNDYFKSTPHMQSSRISQRIQFIC